MNDKLQTINESSDVLPMISRALTDSSVSVEKMERLFDLQARWEKRKAEKEAHLAMIAARGEMPEVAKDTQGQNNKFAKLEKIDRLAYPIYTKNGFSLQWSEVPHETPGWTRLKCVVLHSGGHREEHFLAGPMDDKGLKGMPNKTGIQGMGSTWSYLQRRLLAMIFNIRIVGEDNDGKEQVRQHGPSSNATPIPPDAKSAKIKLWATLKDVRGDAQNWTTAETWLKAHKIIDNSQTVSTLTTEQLIIAEEKASIQLTQ